jgi:hypothetical protein
MSWHYTGFHSNAKWCVFIAINVSRWQLAGVAFYWKISLEITYAFSVLRLLWAQYKGGDSHSGTVSGFDYIIKTHN